MSTVHIKKIFPSIPAAVHTRLAKKLIWYIERLETVSREEQYVYDESSINLPFDTSLTRTVSHAVSEVKHSDLKYIIVVGIGGSNLGTKAVYEGMRGMSNTYNKEKNPQMLFLDTVDQRTVESMSSMLVSRVKSARELLIVVISKSGRTTETIVNAEVLIKRLRRVKNIMKRIVIISDSDSPLTARAKQKGLLHLTIPEKVGGRFSVFSAVGLFPLAVLGIDTKKLQKGARLAHINFLSKNIRKNNAATSALFQYYHYTKGKTISDTFLYHPELESVGKWYRQLMGESIGKEKNKRGTVVHTGITPTVSIGSTDLHSVGQLYMGGPRDKITTFVTTKNINEGTRIPMKSFFGTVDSIEGLSPTDVMGAIERGVERAYSRLSLPYLVLELRDITEGSLGELLQMKMCEMMFLGHLMGVNTFDQPNVELYKKETRRFLLDRT